VAAVAPEVHAVPCAVPLAEFGPVDPVHGFPEYYQDSNGLALQVCLDFVCNPALPVPNPNLPISFPDNFPVEVFYFRAISTITAGSVRALLTYTVTHPYGVEVLQADGAGTVLITTGP